MDLSGFQTDGNVSILSVGMFYQVGYCLLQDTIYFLCLFGRERNPLYALLYITFNVNVLQRFQFVGVECQHLIQTEIMENRGCQLVGKIAQGFSYPFELDTEGRSLITGRCIRHRAALWICGYCCPPVRRYIVLSFSYACR